MELIAPESYVQATDAMREDICNGCGAKGGLPVPNNLLGCNITEACNIHDWMYNENIDKDYCDVVFLANMITLVQRGNFLLRPFRRSMAMKYYLAVAYFGDDAWSENQ